MVKTRRIKLIKGKRMRRTVKLGSYFMGKVKRDSVTVRKSVYVWTSSGSSYYTFVPSSATYHVNIYDELRANNTFIHNAEQYAYMRIKGYSICYVNSLPGQVVTATPQYVTSLPELFFDMTGDVFTGTNGLDSGTVPNSDSCLRVQPNNTMKKCYPKYYRFPSTVMGAGNYILAGSSSWIPTSGFALDTNYAFYVLLGFFSFTNPALTTDSSWSVGKLEIKFYIDFAKKLPVTGPVA